MELKSLQIEITLTEMISERNKIILELNQQNIGLNNQLVQMSEKLEAVSAELEELKQSSSVVTTAAEESGDGN